MTAFLSILLALLFLMMPPSPHAYRAIDVTRARVRYPAPMPGALRDDATVVAIKRDGKVFLGHDEVRLDNLPAKIRASVSRGGEHKVYINADRLAKYKNVREVVVAVRSADVENIGFLVSEAKTF